MALSPRLDLRQTQSLVMTPQLQQAIKLLQLSNLELSAYIEQQLQENPLLERVEAGGDLPADATGSAPDAAEDSGALAQAERAQDVPSDSQGESDSGLHDMARENLWDGETAGGASDRLASGDFSAAAGARGLSGESWGIEQRMANAPSLRDHLVSQLNVDVVSPEDRLIGMHLIEQLDEAGYLTADLAAVAEQFGCPVDRVAVTLQALQRFDPPGIFARELKECLALQLRERDRLDPAMATLLDHLDLVARHDVKALARLCAVDAPDVADMVTEIRALDPKPALAYDPVAAQPISPDIILMPRPGGGWHIELNTETLPRVLVNNRYYAELASSATRKEDKRYITDLYQSANWLVRSLHQRAKTILRVATEIVRQQEGFFAKGVEHLKPLVLREVAGAIEMHESTVSRVTNNKFMETPRGTFELRYFFTTAVGGAGGQEAHSAEAIRHRIKAIIDGEPAARPLSDDQIVASLRREGIDVARRTIAKYREAMRIPSSVERRRAKANYPAIDGG